ncbi:MAG: hypothetical protein Q7U75_10100 [Desulfobacterales bacterium]|nr:hypothetical protein [Desulfobacterales bacterium]
MPQRKMGAQQAAHARPGESVVEGWHQDPSATARDGVHKSGARSEARETMSSSMLPILAL